MNEKLAALRAELARQDEALARFNALLESAADVSLVIHPDFFRDFEEACTPRVSTSPMTFPFQRA